MIIILEEKEANNLIKSYVLSKLEGSVSVTGIYILDSERIRHNLNNCQIQITAEEKE